MLLSQLPATYRGLPAFQTSATNKGKILEACIPQDFPDELTAYTNHPTRG